MAVANLLTQESLDQLLYRLRGMLADIDGVQLPYVEFTAPGYNYPGETLGLEHEPLDMAVFQSIRDLAFHSPTQLTYEVDVKERTFNGRVFPIPSSVLDMPFPMEGFHAINDTSTGQPSHYRGMKPMRPFSEKVWSANYNGSSPTGYYTRGVDYLVNWADTCIYIPPGSSVVRGKWIWVRYEAEPYVIDLGPLYRRWGWCTFGGIDPIRVVAVEYPLGRNPQNFIPFSVWGELLYPHWPDFELKDGPLAKVEPRRIVIYYEADQWIWDYTGTPPVTIPEYFDSSSHFADPRQDFRATQDILLYSLRDLLDDGRFQPRDMPVVAKHYNRNWTLFTEGAYNNLVSAISDMSRHIPMELARDYEISLKVAGEELTLVIGTTLYSLANSLIEPFTDQIWTGAGKSGTQLIRNTDYSIDYSNGRVTWLSTVTPVTYYISYNKSPRAIDVTDIAKMSGRWAFSGNYYTYPLMPCEFIRVVDVEFPIGRIPRRIITHHTWGDKLFLDDRVHDGDVVRVFYEALPTEPDLKSYHRLNKITAGPPGSEATLEVTAEGSVSQNGTIFTITYTFTVYNRGDVDLNRGYVKLEGTPSGYITSNFSAVLPVGQSESYQIVRQVQGTDIFPLEVLVDAYYYAGDYDYQVEVYDTWAFVKR